MVVGSCSTGPENVPVSVVSQRLRVVETSVVTPGQPAGIVFSARWQPNASVEVTAKPLDPAAYGFDPELMKKEEGPIASVAFDKWTERLRDLVADAERTGRGSDRICVVVTFPEDLQIPRFPRPIEDEDRESLENHAVIAEAQQLVEDIMAMRAPGYAVRTQELTSRYAANVQETYWLINGMLIDLPLGQVRSLMQRGDVQYVEERYTNTPPPANTSADARNLMGTDPYFNIGLSGGWFGLLDTGVRTSHTLLTNYTLLRDCVNGRQDCSWNPSSNPDDDCWNHGTASMSELSANGNLGNANRGVSAILVDSWKIYNCSGLDSGAAVRGFQASLLAWDRVLVAQIQGRGSENSAIALAADAAYSAGAVVIAANGNYGPNPNTVSCPGNARKAIGVGAADVESLSLDAESGRGPTNDGRTKPDVLGPTNVYAASTASNTGMQLYDGTSAATPNVAAAAGLLRNFVRGASFETDPGQIYALLINSGKIANGSASDNDVGAGIVSLPNGPSGWMTWGADVVGSSGALVDIPIQVSLPWSVARPLTATIWWPESLGGIHSDIDLQILNPSGRVVGSSTSGPSVFEKAGTTISGPVSGTWTVRIKGYYVASPQVVYFGVFSP